MAYAIDEIAAWLRAHGSLFAWNSLPVHVLTDEEVGGVVLHFRHLHHARAWQSVNVAWAADGHAAEIPAITAPRRFR